jgi:hypothetical protein
MQHDEIEELVNKSASMIDELESALRDSLRYVSEYESEHVSNMALDTLTRANTALNKLENL